MSQADAMAPRDGVLRCSTRPQVRGQAFWGIVR